VGEFDGRVKPNPEEIAAIRWMKVDDAVRDLGEHPDSYTPWFKLSMKGFLDSPEAKKFTG
jgi:isopentenyl-diphosphate delta-isomerase